jgi:hypothetical protein
VFAEGVGTQVEQTKPSQPVAGWIRVHPLAMDWRTVTLEPRGRRPTWGYDVLGPERSFSPLGARMTATTPGGVAETMEPVVVRARLGEREPDTAASAGGVADSHGPPGDSGHVEQTKPPAGETNMVHPLPAS